MATTPPVPPPVATLMVQAGAVMTANALAAVPSMLIVEHCGNKIT